MGPRVPQAMFDQSHPGSRITQLRFRGCQPILTGIFVLNTGETTKTMKEAETKIGKETETVIGADVKESTEEVTQDLVREGQGLLSLGDGHALPRDQKAGMIWRQSLVITQPVRYSLKACIIETFPCNQGDAFRH
jgi:hypothetical protein